MLCLQDEEILAEEVHKYFSLRQKTEAATGGVL